MDRARNSATALKMQHRGEATLFSFDDLMWHLDPSPELAPSPWKKAYDRAAQTALLYQLDIHATAPRIAKAVRITAARNAEGSLQLTPTVFVGDKILGASFVSSALGRRHLRQLHDLNTLLDKLNASDTHCASTFPHALSKAMAVCDDDEQDFGGLPVSSIDTSPPSLHDDFPLSTFVLDNAEDDFEGDADDDEPHLKFEHDSSPEIPDAAESRHTAKQSPAKQRPKSTQNPPAKKRKRVVTKAEKRPTLVEQIHELNSAENPATNVSSSAMDPFYWKLIQPSAPKQVQLRPGYSVFVYESVLNDCIEQYGPDSGMGVSRWTLYGWKIVQHLLGGVTHIAQLKNLDQGSSDRKKGIGIDCILGENVLLAVIGHIRQLFKVSEGIDLRHFKQRMNNNMSALAKRSREATASAVD